MARVAVLSPDLLFGSKVEGALRAAGHEVTADGDGADVVVVDLTTQRDDLARLGALDAPTLGFYAHVDVDTRRRAEAAGFDMVVPRSRMAREGVALVERLVS
jgi:hypothetical protein